MSIKKCFCFTLIAAAIKDKSWMTCLSKEGGGKIDPLLYTENLSSVGERNYSQLPKYTLIIKARAGYAK